MTGPEGQEPTRDEAVVGTEEGEFMPENEPVDADDEDGDDGPYEGAEHLDPRDVPEEEMPDEVLRGLTEAAGDELAGDDDDDVWLDEDDTED